MRLVRSVFLPATVVVAATTCATMLARGQTLATIVPAVSIRSDTDAKSHAIEGPIESAKRAAMQVLDEHCARCHQSDKLVGRSKPAKGFGNILDMDGLAANPKFVKPGDPDGSLIYHVMVRQEMPSDVFQDGDLDHPTPEAKDFEAIKAWIASLAAPKSRSVEVASLPHDAEQIPAVVEARATVSPATTIAGGVRAAVPDPATTSSAGIGFSSRTDPAGALGAARGTEIELPASAKAMVASAEIAPLGDAQGRLVLDTQKSLARLGCFAGEPSGVVDVGTRAALGRYNAVMGRGVDSSPITPELLEELRSETGATCLTAPVVASAPAAEDRADSPAGRVSHAAPVRRAAVQPAPARRVVKVARASAEPRASTVAPARKVATDRLRQPSFRQAESRPVYRQAQHGSGGGSSAGSSSASSTISGLSGI